MQCIYRYLSSKMHLHSKAAVHFCWHYVRDEFFRWRGHRLPSFSFSERLPTPSSLSAPGFNPVFVWRQIPWHPSVSQLFLLLFHDSRFNLLSCLCVLAYMKEKVSLGQRTFLGVFWRSAQSGWRMFLQTSCSTKQQPASKVPPSLCLKGRTWPAPASSQS